MRLVHAIFVFVLCVLPVASALTWHFIGALIIIAMPVVLLEYVKRTIQKDY